MYRTPPHHSSHVLQRRISDFSRAMSYRLSYEHPVHGPYTVHTTHLPSFSPLPDISSFLPSLLPMALSACAPRQVQVRVQMRVSNAGVPAALQAVPHCTSCMEENGCHQQFFEIEETMKYTDVSIPRPTLASRVNGNTKLTTAPDGSRSPTENLNSRDC